MRSSCALPLDPPLKHGFHVSRGSSASLGYLGCHGQFTLSCGPYRSVGSLVVVVVLFALIVLDCLVLSSCGSCDSLVLKVVKGPVVTVVLHVRFWLFMLGPRESRQTNNHNIYKQHENYKNHL